MKLSGCLPSLLCFLPVAAIAATPVVNGIAANPAPPACWEPYSSPAPLKAACYFDAKKLGLGIQGMKLGRVEVSKDDNKIKCLNVSKSGGELSSQTFRWLRLNEKPLIAEAQLPFNNSVENFISKIPYCPRTLPRDRSTFPLIPAEYQHSQVNDDYICRILESGKLVIGSEFEDGACEDTLGIVYSGSTQPAFVPEIAAGWHVLSIGHGWPIRVENGQPTKAHFKCKKHCKAHAKNEAERLAHRYAGYDGDNWYTGQRVDLNDIDKDNIVFQNTHYPDL